MLICRALRRWRDCPFGNGNAGTLRGAIGAQVGVIGSLLVLGTASGPGRAPTLQSRRSAGDPRRLRSVSIVSWVTIAGELSACAADKFAQAERLRRANASCARETR
jgi:hypothetical protein